MLIDPRQPDYTNTPASTGRARFGYAPGPESGRNGPLVSVVTPFFNPGVVFEETARSLFAQSLQDFEWIIVNDRSDDPASVAVLDSYRSRDPRIRVIDLPQNSGPSAARNAGFESAGSEYVYQLDSDDLIEPTTLEKCFWFLLRHPKFAFCNTAEVGFGAQGYLWGHGFHSHRMFLSECPVGSHTVMARKSAHKALGGYDESIRGGMEDWEFWLRAADRGTWGVTLPEYLAWYRRCANHRQRWADWDGGERQRKFQDRLEEQHPRLFADIGAFPQMSAPWHLPFEGVERRLPARQSLAKDKPRLLLIVPWLRMGGADKFNLDLLDQLIARGWEVTVACTVPGANNWLPQFAARTPDIFILHHFVRPVDQPLFLRYLIDSRRPDAVMIANSELAYMALPYLRSVCPEPVYVDYVHMEESYWKNGGYARYSVGAQEQLDLTMVTSRHLRSWMGKHGADESRIEVCTINVDPDAWAPDAALRAKVRAELKIADGECVILYAGRLTQQKQPKVFAATVKELADKGVRFRAVVAGDGEDRPFVEEYLEHHRLGTRVTMLGETSAARMRELMAAADIFFLPSLWEGIALVLYEAMAAGVVFVGADVGGQKEVLTSECGVLLPRDDNPQVEASRYARVLADLAGDGPRRARMGACAIRRIRDHFALCRMGDSVVAGLRRAADLKQEAPRATVGAGFAGECADRAVEFIRVNQLADWLWAERQRALSPALGSAQLESRHGVSGIADSAIYAELAAIEGSRSYRLIQRAKRTWLYRALARLRFGAGWDAPDPAEPALLRLSRIKGSRSYRLVTALRAIPVYRSLAGRV